MYLARVFEISYSGRKNQKNVAWNIAFIFLVASIDVHFAYECDDLSRNRPDEEASQIPELERFVQRLRLD